MPLRVQFAPTVFGIKAKPELNSLKIRSAVCTHRIWSQGKAKTTCHQGPASSLHPPYLESRQSRTSAGYDGIISLHPPYLESRQSIRHGLPVQPQSLHPPYLESRQSFTASWVPFPDRLHPPYLESRQSEVPTMPPRGSSLHPPYLESRQSMGFVQEKLLLVCTHRIWNQGKAGYASALQFTTVCTHRIWNQGKATVTYESQTAEVCTHRIWNQGKARIPRPRRASKFAPPVFGIKAKLAWRSCSWRPKVLHIHRILESRQSMSNSRAVKSRVCTHRIWNQGKAQKGHARWRCEFAPTVFGIKAKPSSYLDHKLRQVCTHRIWNPRQSIGMPWRASFSSLHPPYLESRQSNRSVLADSFSRVCTPRIWNQGKAALWLYQR